jgi:hypothetical protein
MRLLLKDLAAFLEAGPATAARFAAWDWRGQDALARALLSGRRIVAPQAVWRALAADLPAPVAEACLAVAGDRAEAAALLMGRAEGPEVTLDEVAAVEPEGVLALARRMAPAERAAFFRLIGGQRRDLAYWHAMDIGECNVIGDRHVPPPHADIGRWGS